MAWTNAAIRSGGACDREGAAHGVLAPWRPERQGDLERHDEPGDQRIDDRECLAHEADATEPP